MSKRTKIKISRVWRRLFSLGRAVGLVYISFLSVVPPGGAMASTDEPANQMVVYYLSPTILTRIAMTPERLETDKSRVDSKDLPTSDLVNLLRKIRSRNHQPTGKSRFAYDFRLCIRTDGRSTCFSADGVVGYTSGEPFSLSADERDDVLNIFQKMNAAGGHGPGNSTPTRK